MDIWIISHLRCTSREKFHVPERGIFSTSRYFLADQQAYEVVQLSPSIEEERVLRIDPLHRLVSPERNAYNRKNPSSGTWNFPRVVHLLLKSTPLCSLDPFFLRAILHVVTVRLFFHFLVTSQEAFFPFPEHNLANVFHALNTGKEGLGQKEGRYTDGEIEIGLV